MLCARDVHCSSFAPPTLKSWIRPCGIFMFLCHRKLLPTSLLKYYSLNCNIQRNAADFHIPKARTIISYKFIVYQGPVVWNSIPNEIQVRNSKLLIYVNANTKYFFRLNKWVLSRTRVGHCLSLCFLFYSFILVCVV